ncbi:MAG: xanthine dehydrogenase family protein molybdopterin-binding subunit [Burkholderiaceae bacterium]|nr:xanthine dehydrogenase family protein molybdopterin-binding subunit [Burkholderiaceae bacterium]
MKRRHLLLGTAAAAGALVVGWGLLPPRQRLQGGQPLPAADGQWPFNGWVRIGRDDQVGIVMARSEMGQGVHTALAMLLAEELDADWARVRSEAAPVDAIYNNLATVVDGLPFHPDDDGWVKRLAGWLTAKTMREIGLMVTGGSSSIKDAWMPMRQAGASARAMLMAAAAQRWQVPAADCRTEAGRVLHAASGRSASYGELAEAAAALPLPATDGLVLKTPDQWRLIGRSQPRREAASKHDGTARFGIDALQPGQRFASLVLNPQLGGAAPPFDAAALRGQAGVRALVGVPALHGASGGVAVVADTPWQALRAARGLAGTLAWPDGPAKGLDSAGIGRQLQAALEPGAGFAYFKTGDAEAALAGAARTVEARYEAPLLAHATLEPQNATVLYQPEQRRATVWAPTQVPGLARWAAAQVLGLESEQVTLHVTLLGGGFGRRLDVDFVAQAAAVAKTQPGVPVQSFVSREQDQTHDFYRPPCVAHWRAGLDAQGRLLGLQVLSAGPSIVQQFLQRNFGLSEAMTVGPDKTTCEGAFDQAYEWPAARIAHRIVPLPVPVGFWRSVGHSHQAFFKECFIDECAAAAGRDPLDFRLDLLQRHPRQAAVLRLAAAQAGWGQAPAAAPDGAKAARGLALHQSFGSIVAQVAEVSLDPADAKRIRVHRVVVAIDCGVVVHPDMVRQQMEGSIVQALGTALHGEITLADGRVQQSNFHDQPLLRASDCPRIETHIVASAHPPEGVGEPGLPPLAPAVANALATLTGQRVRRLPLKLS